MEKFLTTLTTLMVVVYLITRKTLLKLNTFCLALEKNAKCIAYQFILVVFVFIIRNSILIDMGKSNSGVLVIYTVFNITFR